ncbi:MAG: efflux RND transporter periplasmic adaptor subunit [Gammaproteobacteria bacterium]
MKRILLPLILLVCGVFACEQNDRHAPSGVSPMPEPVSKALVVYQCPMHPTFTSENKDAKCPTCGMSLVATSRKNSTFPEDAISVSSAMVQSMGVRTALAEITDLGQTLRAFGSVETNERKENVTVSRIEGWIDNLRVNAEGDTVRRGTLLYRVYSPDLIAAQKDYLNSLDIGNDKRIDAVGQRLRSLGMQKTAIDGLLESRKILERVPVYAEAGGVVAQLDVRDGDYVKPGSPVMRLQSYQNVWVIASIPEQDLALVSNGLTASLTFPSAPEASVDGEIDYVYPTIDVKTRTGKVRIEVNNQDGYLRPGAYADIIFNLSDRPRLSIPTESILRDSRGQHVITALGNGRFGSRTIKTGISNGVRTEVMSGLDAGEQVVVSGQFLLDSEVNLREGLSKLTGGDGPQASPSKTDAHAGHNH